MQHLNAIFDFNFYSYQTTNYIYYIDYQFQDEITLKISANKGALWQINHR